MASPMLVQFARVGGREMKHDDSLVVVGHRVTNVRSRVQYYDAQVRNGPSYYRYVPVTPADELSLEDLALCVLLEGQPSSGAARELAELAAADRDLSGVPTTELHLTSDVERGRIIDTVMRVVQLKGFASSLATKLLHKKRPRTIPILDNEAIYGTMLSGTWRAGDRPTRGGSVTARSRIEEALGRIFEVVADEQNAATFRALEAEHSGLSRIQILDKAWWGFVRQSAQ